MGSGRHNVGGLQALTTGLMTTDTTPTAAMATAITKVVATITPDAVPAMAAVAADMVVEADPSTDLEDWRRPPPGGRRISLCSCCADTAIVMPIWRRARSPFGLWSAGPPVTRRAAGR